MGNVLCSCCVKRSHTPYDPFIYDQEYDDYVTTSNLDSSKIDTYNPPTVIKLEPTNYDNSKYYPMSNSVMNVKDNYYNGNTKQQPQQQQTNTFNKSTYSQSPNLSQSPTFKSTSPTFKSTSPNNNNLNTSQFDNKPSSVSFSTVHKYYHHSGSFGPNNTANRIINPIHQNNIDNTNNTIHEDDSDLYENNNNGGIKKENNNSNLDKFYPHYSNVSDSVYMTQPPTSELGINDSIMDSIVLGVQNKPSNSAPRISFVPNNNINNINNSQTTTTTTTTTTTNSNYHSEPSSPSNSTYSSVNSSTIESQYFDTQNSFSQ